MVYQGCSLSKGCTFPILCHTPLSQHHVLDKILVRHLVLITNRVRSRAYNNFTDRYSRMNIILYKYYHLRQKLDLLAFISFPNGLKPRSIVSTTNWQLQSVVLMIKFQLWTHSIYLHDGDLAMHDSLSASPSRSDKLIAMTCYNFPWALSDLLWFPVTSGTRREGLKEK